MFDRMLAEIEFLKSEGRVPGILEGVMYMLENEDQYPSEVRRELKEFMRQGRQLFKPR